MLPEQQNLSQTMLNAEQLATFKQTIAGFSPLQLAWASGYLAAKSETGDAVVSQPASVAGSVAEQTLTILFGSQTGNAKGVAKQLAELAQSQGLSVNLKNMSDYKAKSLKNETHLLIVASTNGEGEAPDDAIEFHEFLASKKAPKLEQLNYSVLALGDSSYEFFCQTGKDFDDRLAALGAKRIAERVDCDVDYQADADSWSERIVSSVKEQFSATSAESTVVNLPVGQSAPVSQYSKQNPYAAELSVSQKITGRDSNKDVRHIEIDLGESGLTYQPGDALGVWPTNDEQLVSELITELGYDANEQVTVSDKTLSLKDALINELEITLTAPNFVEFWAKTSGNEALLSLVGDKAALREFAANHQIVDVVKLAKTDLDAQTFVETLRKITPRLYSIASSQSEVDEEVHLTVALVEYQQDGKQRKGTASDYLANRLADGESVNVFIEHNDNFRLPQDANTPVIMIGPGTGVAPFRAFMQEREAQDAAGENWLFFGDQTFTQDFLYQVEWQNYLKAGLLTKIDLAFSRDQQEKIYVQQRLKENAAQVYSWLERGAHIYVCGDMSRMAKDVHQALIEIISEQGNKSQEDAEQYLKELRSAKRYQKDVY